MHRAIPDFTTPTAEAVDNVAERLRILSDPTRLKLLWAMAQGETSVACLADLAGATPTATSQHLAKLRMTGLVKVRRQGTFMYYALEDEEIAHLLEFLFGKKTAARESARRGRSRAKSAERIA